MVGQPHRTRGRGLERHVHTDEVVVDQIRIQTQLQMVFGLGQTRRPLHQHGQRMTQGQVEPFHERRVDADTRPRRAPVRLPAAGGGPLGVAAPHHALVGRGEGEVEEKDSSP